MSGAGADAVGGAKAGAGHGSEVENHGVHHGDAAGHGSLRGYLIGFGLSVVLTGLAFWLVMADVLPRSNLTAIAVMALAAAQIVVHMIFFLHMNTKSEGGWTMLAMIFTIVVVVITLSGSLWVMYHLNSNMMQMHHHEAPMR